MRFLGRVRWEPPTSRRTPWSRPRPDGKAGGRARASATRTQPEIAAPHRAGYAGILTQDCAAPPRIFRDLLQRPAVTVRVGEVDEPAPRLLVDVTDFDAALGQLGARLIGARDHHLHVVERPRRHPGQPLAHRDRAARPGRRQLHEPDVLAHGVVVVQHEPDLHIEVLRPVDIGHGHGHQLQFHVHADSL